MQNLKHLYRNSNQHIGQNRFIYMAGAESNEKAEQPLKDSQAPLEDSRALIENGKAEAVKKINGANNELTKLAEGTEKSPQEKAIAKIDKALSDLQAETGDENVIANKLKNALNSSLTVEDKQVLQGMELHPNPPTKINGHTFAARMLDNNSVVIEIDIPQKAHN